MKKMLLKVIVAAISILAFIMVGTIKDYIIQPEKSYQLPAVSQQAPIEMLGGKWLEHAGGNWVWETVYRYETGGHVNNEKVRIEFQFPYQKGPYGIQYSKHGLFQDGYIIHLDGRFTYSNGTEVTDKSERSELKTVADTYLNAFPILLEYALANK